MSHKKLRLTWRIRTPRLKAWEAAADQLGMSLGEYLFWCAERTTNSEAVQEELDRRSGKTSLADQLAEIADDLGKLGGRRPGSGWF